MPGNLSVRNLDDELIARLRQRATGNGVSAEEEVRHILRQVLDREADSDFARLAAELRQLTAGQNHTPAETLRREEREQR